MYPAAQDDAGQHAPPPPGFLGVPPAPPVVVQEVPVPDSGSSSTGWLGGLFGKKKQDKVAGGYREPEVLQMDLPPTAIPSFD